MVHGQSERDIAAPVVTDGGEPVVAQVCHEGEHVAGHRPFRRLAVVRHRWRGGRTAVPAQVWADDGVTGRDEQWGDPVPGGVRSRMTVEQHDSRAGATDPVANPDTVGNSHPPQIEAFEHPAIMTAFNVDRASDATGHLHRRQWYGVVVDTLTRPERSRMGREYSVESLLMSDLPVASAERALAAVNAR